MKKILVCPLVKDKTQEEIKSYEKYAHELLDDRYDFISFSPETSLYRFPNDVVAMIGFLSYMMNAMCGCSSIFFFDGWEKDHCCRIMHETAKAFGIEIVHEWMFAPDITSNCTTDNTIPADHIAKGKVDGVISLEEVKEADKNERTASL